MCRINYDSAPGGNDTLRYPQRALPAFALALTLAGCTSGNAGKTVPYTSTPVAATLQFAVGTANIAYAGGSVTGLNTVETFRNASGLDASLVNTPVITGPPAFRVPASEPANSDAGTSHISGNPQSIAAPATPATFGTSGGAFAYGFEPENSDTTGGANFGVYSLPFYADQISASFTASPFEGGPPYYPRVTDGTYPAGFAGFTQGFTDFVATPVTGTYTLTVTVPAAQAQLAQTFKATSTLSVIAPLGAIPAPLFTEDGSGGGSVTVTLPAGLVEAAAYITDESAGAYFTVPISPTAGTHTVVLGDAYGASSGGPAGATLPAGDVYQVIVVGFDYPALHASAPNNTSQKPVITGANGQADLTQSPSLTATYGAAATGALRARHAVIRRQP